MSSAPDHSFASAGLPNSISVSELNKRVRQRLESGFPLQWIRGEISNLTRAPSGHLYFTLKDNQAQVRCAMWRNRAQLLPFQPANGLQVEARALVTLYEARGDFQLTVEGLRRAGAGDLHAAFLALRDRLAAEGLFASALKRLPPRYPRSIAVVTSPQAAALRDVLATLARRAPGISVVLYPSTVQGVEASQNLCLMLQRISQRAARDGVEVLLMVRGGGSMEDLWAYNDETLARCIRACPIPVITGIGHETDFTIADFAADLRAPTPTAAAELASSGFHEAAQHLAQLSIQLQRNMRHLTGQHAQRLDRAAMRLRHPRARLESDAKRLQHLEQTLHKAIARQSLRAQLRLQKQAEALRRHRPALDLTRHHLAMLARTLTRSQQQSLQAHHTRLDLATQQLALLSPHNVLARGYSITRDENGVILRNAAALMPGQRIDVQMQHGRVSATVGQIEAADLSASDKTD